MLTVIDVSNSIYLRPWFPFLLIFISITLGIFGPEVYKRISRLIPYYVESLKIILSGIKIRKGIAYDTVDEVIEAAGYSYDSNQDIFYSDLDAWQRNMGYCRLYDEAAAPLSMIIDCEPIYFEYEGKRWLIEFWKGQYGMTTGCEIGVYATEGPDLNIDGVFNGTFYFTISDKDLLEMSFYLQKDGKTLFKRSDRHWWLTGFKLGEFSNPSQLTMILYIKFKNNTMRRAFVKGLMNAGYLRNEISIRKNTVGVRFKTPHTQQPFTRTKYTDTIIQRKNQLLCDKYQEITEGYDNSLDKINAIQKQAPHMLRKVLNIGKTEQLFNKYKKIKNYLK